MALEAAKGAAESGVYSYFKHYALNDQETNRTNMMCTWTTEQAARENYLKAFEIAVKGTVAENIPAALMASFNYIGTTWSGAYKPVQTDILRGEWGFRGMVLTDYFGGYGYMNATQAIYNGTDIMLCPMDMGINHADLSTASNVVAARNSAHNILYTVTNSRAVAEAGGLPAWVKTVIAVDICLAAVLILLEVITIKNYKKRAGTAVVQE
ncbi:MAG: beta-glucosidase, partial [Pseudobutyrivibrio sp.]|nr:beta-glucosidase [Pseudobutyrivibrio sp.]